MRVLGIGVKVTGYGILNPAHAGELDVRLGPPGHGPDPANAGKFEKANYLVFGLGPVVSGSFYDYAMVSDPSGESLYVLARNVTRFQERYEGDVLATLKHLNFTSFLNKPRKSSQEGCKYVPPPRHGLSYRPKFKRERLIYRSIHIRVRIPVQHMRQFSG